MDVKYRVSKLIENGNNVDEWLDFLDQIKLKCDTDVLIEIYTTALNYVSKTPVTKGYKKLLIGLANLVSKESPDHAESVFKTAKEFDSDCSIVCIYYAQFECRRQKKDVAQSILRKAKCEGRAPKILLKIAYQNWKADKLDLFDGVADPWDDALFEATDTITFTEKKPIKEPKSPVRNVLRHISSSSSSILSSGKVKAPVRHLHRSLTTSAMKTYPKKISPELQEMERSSLSKLLSSSHTPDNGDNLISRAVAEIITGSAQPSLSPFQRNNIKLFDDENTFLFGKESPGYPNYNFKNTDDDNISPFQMFSGKSMQNNSFQHVHTSVERKPLSERVMNEEKPSVGQNLKTIQLDAVVAQNCIDFPNDLKNSTLQNKENNRTCLKIVKNLSDPAITMNALKSQKAENKSIMDNRKISSHQQRDSNEKFLPCQPNLIVKTDEHIIKEHLASSCVEKKNIEKLSTSDKIIHNSATPINTGKSSEEFMASKDTKLQNAKSFHLTGKDNLSFASFQFKECGEKNQKSSNFKTKVSPKIINSAEGQFSSLKETSSSCSSSKTNITSENINMVNSPEFQKVQTRVQNSNSNSISSKESEMMQNTVISTGSDVMRNTIISTENEVYNEKTISPQNNVKASVENITYIKTESAAVGLDENKKDKYDAERNLKENKIVRTNVAVDHKENQLREMKKLMEEKVSFSSKDFIVKGKKYFRKSCIGHGGSCKVYEVVSEEGSIYALKKVKLEGCEEFVMETYVNEIKWLEKLQGHSCIIELIDWEEQSGNLLIVLEKGDTDLAHIMKSNNLTIGSIKRYWNQIVSAVNVIHNVGIIHTDLKPANFLFVGNILKLIDFGIASRIQDNKTSVTRLYQMGTISYMAPETLSSGGLNCDGAAKVSKKSDVWSLGCILYAMFYKKTPYQHHRNQHTKINAILTGQKINFEGLKDPVALDCLKGCLTHSKKDRYSIAQLLEHEFMKGGDIN